MRRISILAATSLLAVAALGGTALAKEGAVTKFDGLPGIWHAGQTYTVGYTILMDGVQPYKADTTEILIRNATGKALAYPGIADGKPGHYVAKVFFPIAGSWTMQVTQGSHFPPMDVGTFSVQAPVPGGAPSTSSPADTLGQAAPFAAALVAFAGALALARLVRTQRRVSATA